MSKPANTNVCSVSQIRLATELSRDRLTDVTVTPTKLSTGGSEISLGKSIAIGADFGGTEEGVDSEYDGSGTKIFHSERSSKGIIAPFIRA
jgi:hypothetical protein